MIVTQPRIPEQSRSADHSDDQFLTMDALAAQVGMSPRNIRAHQARRLLPPPVRRGRSVYYTQAHVRRLESVKALQRQGFNLVSIESMLGVRKQDQVSSNLDTLLANLQHDQPGTIYALLRHGVLVRAEDGSLRVLSPRPLFAALELQRAGIAPNVGLPVLTDLLDRTQNVGAQMIESAAARIIALRRSRVHGQQRSWEDLDAEAAVLTRSLVALLVEVFRTTVENRSRSGVVEMMAAAGENDFQLDDSEPMADIG